MSVPSQGPVLLLMVAFIAVIGVTSLAVAIHDWGARKGWWRE